MLSREELLKGIFLRQESLDIPELGGRVILQEMSAPDYLTYQKFLQEDAPEKGQVNMQTAYAKMAVRGIVDEKGERVFQDEDVSHLARMPYRILGPIAEAFTRVNGATKEAQEEAVKNSEPSTS